jgi:D-alanine transaminase
MTVYLNGKYLPMSEARISPLDRGFLYGDSVYEVLRAYGGTPFRLEAHMARLGYSLGELRMGAYLQPLHEVPARLLGSNGLETGEALVYLQVTRGAPAVRSHAFPATDVPPTIFGYAWAFSGKREWYDPGVRAITVPDVRWSRCDIKVTALTPNVQAHQRALDAGAHEALFVRDGAVLEGSLSSLFTVFEGQVLTAPLSNYILPSITREVVLEICGELGIPVRETPVFEHDLPEAEEAFLASTVHEIAPISRIDAREMPRERPVTTRVREAFRALVARETGAA